MTLLNQDRLLPVDKKTRTLARTLFDSVRRLPIISPHGHTDPRWFARNCAFPDPAELFVKPDHYVFRMLHSQGISLDSLGIPRIDGEPVETDSLTIWRLFAHHYHLLRGTPSRIWIDHSFQEVFGIDQVLNADSADDIYGHIAACLARPEFLPRALYERFNIEVIATTETPLDDLKWHRQIRDSGWQGRVITAFRPDNVIDAERADFARNIELLGQISGCDTMRFSGYLEALFDRRAFFKAHGATSTDHGHASARTETLPEREAENLFQRALGGTASAEEADRFRGHMLTEMARMSLEDGLVMQIHSGAWRNHNATVFRQRGPDMGFDIPRRTDYVAALKPLLDELGHRSDLTIILFTLDETAFSRELAPLAGVYPCLKLGPPWWFLDSAAGMHRFRETVTETAGFYNTVGFNDDTRAFCSISARHDVARRVDCAYLAQLVATGRLGHEDAHKVAADLAYHLAKKAYRL